MKRIRIRYIILLTFIFFLIFNEGNRTLVRRHFEINKLNKGIKYAQYQNELLKKRIYYLENESAYLERMVRSELNVVAPGELEYRFSIKED
ncbi:MAG: septum formation initiator family protein [Endomicrobium sp.]|jgi:cell division protein FtsB|nr:septum formation initiator family protein [Endomicrobium sp.]